MTYRKLVFIVSGCPFLFSVLSQKFVSWLLVFSRVRSAWSGLLSFASSWVCSASCSVTMNALLRIVSNWSSRSWLTDRMVQVFFVLCTIAKPMNRSFMSSSTIVCCLSSRVSSIWSYPFLCKLLSVQRSALSSNFVELIELVFIVLCLPVPTTSVGPFSVTSSSSPLFIPYCFIQWVGMLSTYVLPAICMTLRFMLVLSSV